MSYILVHAGLFECFHDPPLPWYNRPGWLGIKKNKLLTIIYQTLTGSTESSTCKCVLFAYIYTQGMLAYGLVQRYNATPKRIFTVAISTSLYRNPIYTTVQPTGLDTYPVPWCIRQQRLLVTWVDPGQRKRLLVVTAALTASSRHPDQARSKQQKPRGKSACVVLVYPRHCYCADTPVWSHHKDVQVRLLIPVIHCFAHTHNCLDSK